MRSILFRLFPSALILIAFALACNAQTRTATITFDNRSGDFAVVKLIGPSKHVAEVPDGERRTVNASGGNYYIVTRFGSKPDSYSYERGDNFNVTQTATKHSVITITLHKIVNGNYDTKPISAEEFEKH
jgi:hypothetical protein